MGFDYINGSTIEEVFADTECTCKVGFLNPKEKCRAIGTIGDKIIIMYHVGNSTNIKIGFVRYKGGVKI